MSAWAELEGSLLLRFVWAVVAFVIAALLIGAGIAQRTVFLGPKTEQASIEVAQELPYTLVDGAVLTSHPGAQTLLAQAEGPVFAAYGRTADLRAWLSDATYNHIVLDDADVIGVEVVEPIAPADDQASTEGEVPVDGAAPPAAPAEGEAPAEGDAAADATATDDPELLGRDPAGSDLWLDEFTQEDRLIAKFNLPETMSVLIATDGTEPAPAGVQLSWPISNSTPWAGPLMVLGGIVMAAGVVLYLLGIRHVRRSRGPRRKAPPPLPETEPLDTLPEAEAKGVITSGPNQRRALGGRAFTVVPAVAVSALLFAGCSAEAWPQFGPSPSPSPTPSVVDAEDAQAPAVTERQAERLLARIAQTVAAADEAGDAELAATRLGGAVLDERKTNYTIRAKFADYAPLTSIPTENVTVVLPQARNDWPRTVMMVVDEAGATDDGAAGEGDDDTADAGEDAPEGEGTTEPTAPRAPVILLMTQDDPWSDYKLTYAANFIAGTTLPEVAASTIGAPAVPPDSTFLMIAPDELAAAYADVVENGADSEFSSLFTDEDGFRTMIAQQRETQLQQFNQTAAETGTLTFATAAGTYSPFALATLESGAIVAVTLVETETVKPTNEDAVIKLDGNRAAQALTGATSAAKGIQTNVLDQLFFYVPNQASNGQIQLLGFDSHVLSAGVIE